MKITPTILFGGLLLAGSAASADTTAVYKAKSKTIQAGMTVEIANDGSTRYQMSMGRTYGLVLRCVDYFVELGAKGPIVARADDLMTAQKEAMAAFMPPFQHHDMSAGPQLVPIGNVTINGRTGRGFGYRPEKKDATVSPVVVVSDDPELAQLGKLMANQLAKSIAMLSGMVGSTPGMFKQMQSILQTGAPLSFAGMELQSVNHAPIDPKRFNLPAQPETLDQIRERMKPLAPPPTASPPKR